MIRILLVNDTSLKNNLLAAVLKNEPDMLVSGSTVSAEEAIRRVERQDIDVLLVSAGLPDCGAQKVSRAVTSAYPDLKVLILELVGCSSKILEYVEAGAVGYVSHNATVEEMLASIRAAQRKEARVTPEVAGALMSRLASLSRSIKEVEDGSVSTDVLTPREMQVLELLSKDLSNQEIADQLFIQVGTVKNHVHNILNKLSLRSRKEAVSCLSIIRSVQSSMDQIAY
jgi:two-component system, NarL family, nitrate/nitrite response regulator NarL